MQSGLLSRGDVIRQSLLMLKTRLTGPGIEPMRTVVVNGREHTSVEDAAVNSGDYNTGDKQKDRKAAWAACDYQLKKYKAQFEPHMVTHQFNGQGQKGIQCVDDDGLLKLFNCLKGPFACELKQLQQDALKEIINETPSTTPGPKRVRNAGAPSAPDAEGGEGSAEFDEELNVTKRHREGPAMGAVCEGSAQYDKEAMELQLSVWKRAPAAIKEQADAMAAAAKTQADAMAAAAKTQADATAAATKTASEAEAEAIERKGRAEAAVIEAKGKAENSVRAEALHIWTLENDQKERERQFNAPPPPPPPPPAPTAPPPPAPTTPPPPPAATAPAATPVAVPPPVVGLAPCAKTVRDIAKTESGWDGLSTDIRETILSQAGRSAARKPHIVQMTEKIYEIDYLGFGHDVAAYNAPYHAAVRTEVLAAWRETMRKDASQKSVGKQQRAINQYFSRT